MEPRQQYWVLIVGKENTKRSPLAAGLLLFLAETKGLDEYLVVDSAGTSVKDEGASPDEKIQVIAENHGFRLNHEARPVDEDDLTEFDEILALDKKSLEHLKKMTKEASLLQKIRLFTDHDPRAEKSAEILFDEKADEEAREEFYEKLWYCCRGFLKAVEE